jgi:sugar O-acyltransferase (sialic acid O-acetyltransferase NeuD family)
MQKLLIFPYSGTGIEALDCLGDEWDCIGFITDDESQIGKELFNIKVYSRKALEDFPEAMILAVNGSPTSYLNRQKVIKALNIPSNRFARVIHKNASVSKLASIGYNVLIMAGAVITANAEIANHVIILPNSVVHHDSIIEEYTLVAGNVIVAGNVTIGRNCYLGAGSSIKNGISIHPNSLIGIGANVIQTTSESCVLIGNPAKVLKEVRITTE